MKLILSCGDQRRGFTLVELVVVVAIVAILVAIAYPSYIEQIARGRRSDAKAVLQEAAQVMERRYTECGGYNMKSDCSTTTDLTLILPTNLQTSPKDGSTKWYFLNTNSGMSLIAGTTFRLVFTPQNAQANDKCLSYSITNTGQKEILNSSAVSVTTLVDDCWNR